MTQHARGLCTALAAAAFAVPLLVPSPPAGARPVLEGTDWNLAGRAAVNGVVRERRRAYPFRDSVRASLAVSLDAGNSFTAVDHDGRRYTGTWEQRGRSGTAVRVALDAGSSDLLTSAIDSWIEDLAERDAEISVRSTSIRATVRGQRMSLSIVRAFSVQTSNATARCRYVARESGRKVL